MSNKIFRYILLLAILILALFLSQVFAGRIILPQTFSFGPLTVHYYGIIMAGAVFSAFYLGLKRAKLYQLGEKQAEDLMFWLILGGFLGARLYHVLTELSYYRQNPVDILKVWQGGLGIYGAVAGGLITLLIYLKVTQRSTLNALRFLDWLAPSVILGQIIGRFGNFFNYELYGYPTNLPWKMFVPAQFRPEGYVNSNFFHPVFLYEALGNLAILIFLLWLESRTRRPVQTNQNDLGPSVRDFAAPADSSSKTTIFARSGSLFFFYLLLYNVLRFSVEFLKIDSQFIGPFRLNVILGFILIIFSAAIIFKLNRKQWKNTINTSQ